MREYVHRSPGELAEPGPLEFTVLEEGLVRVEGRELIYLVGDTPIGSACVGAGVLRYIFVPGFVAAWHAGVSADGVPASVVEPVTDEGARARVRELLAAAHPGLQVCF